MRPEIVSIVVLLGLFVAGTVLPVNLGALGFVAAFLVGAAILHMPPEDIITGFPSDLFLLLVGITYLFGIAQANGTIDVLVSWTIRLVRGRAAALPWMFFSVSALLMAIGALFAVAIVAPIAMRFAARFKMSPLLIGMMVVHGALAGAFSPISVYGSFVNALVTKTGLPSSPMTLFVCPLVFNLAIAVVLFMVLGGRELMLVDTAARSGNAGDMTRLDDDLASGSGDIRAEQVATIIGVIVLAVGTAAFRLNVGFLSMSIAVALALLSPRTQKDAVDRISWSTVLLITGMLTYVSVLEKTGTIGYVSRAVTALGTPLVAALLFCLIGGVTSAFASSAAILGVTVPLVVPFLKEGHIGAIGMIAALAVATTVVDVSPFSTNGALVLANAQTENRERFYRQMLIYSAVVVTVGPFLAWALLVLPGWL
jgi:Na+/H+ antiporter NhaD/arsenite permease-like protein